MDRTTRKLGKKKLPDIEQHKTRLVQSEKIQRLKENCQLLAEKNVSFSFFYFKRSDDKYNMGNVDSPWFIRLKDVLKDVSQYKMRDFIPSFNHARRWRCHPLDDSIVEEFGLENDFLDQIRDDCFQFSISQAKGRVLGFNIKSVFFIVLLDFHHNADPGIFGVQSQYSPKTLEDQLTIEISVLRSEIAALKSEKDQLETDYLELLCKFDQESAS